jgi:hypothetical protein
MKELLSQAKPTLLEQMPLQHLEETLLFQTFNNPRKAKNKSLKNNHVTGEYLWPKRKNQRKEKKLPKKPK